MRKEWKPIKGYEELYKISNFGQIRTFQPRWKNFRILNCNSKSGPYITVQLCKNQKIKSYAVHLLVLENFIGPRPNSNITITANHKDGNKQNNRLDNLEWITQKENIAHGFKIGLSSHRMGENIHTAKLTENDVLKIRKLYDKNDIKCVKNLATQFDVNIHTIYHIINNYSWKHLINKNEAT